MKRWIPALVIVVAAFTFGCNDNQLGIDKRSANRPPETTLSAGPPDSTTNTRYNVRLNWSGSDPDGVVDHYDFILVNHPAAKDNIDGSGPETVIIVVPKPDDPRWRGSAATDSLFISLADTLRNGLQPSDSTGTADDIRRMLWERWHTFFIRAVDNEGMPDPSPDYRSFNSTNIAPSVFLTEPIQAGVPFDGPSVIVFNWDGEDLQQNNDVIDPVASRWVLIDSQIDGSKKPLSFPDSLYVLPERFEWQPWRRWDAEDESGRRAIVRNLLQVQSQPDGSVVGYYVFAVQAMDEAGAITPVFDTDTGGRNNAVAVKVSGAVGPLLTVRETFLGVSRFLGKSPPVQIDVAAGQPLQFSWLGDATRYGGEIQDYRYGWNILDPDNDAEWTQNWCASCLKADPRTFSAGTHTLFIQVRDNANTIQEAQFILIVNQVTLSRDLLWVDDTQEVIPNSGQERIEDIRWLGLLSELADENGFEFDPVLDVFDAQDERAVPPITKVFDYKAIVWSVRGAQSATALELLARFVDPFLEKNANTVRAFNFLGIYLKNNGRLWVNGFKPGKLIFVELTREQEEKAINVTNWDDDPAEQHPGIDSVGTLSLLYALGVEMFDCGGGTGCGTRGNRRNSLLHFCRGLARAVPQGAEVQTFSTDIYAGAPHSHLLDVLTADVDFPGGDSVTYQTSLKLDHRHSVIITPDDFRELQAGNTITVVTEPAAAPETHTHEIELIDQLGLWGLPIMITGAAWSPAPPDPGRPNVEIYNMPGTMAVQQPRLVPLTGISTELYTYVSGVRENADTGTFYPLTADRQPVALLAKGAPSDRFFTRAICGFEPEFLSPLSHKALAEYIIVRHFRIGIGDGF